MKRLLFISGILFLGSCSTIQDMVQTKPKSIAFSKLTFLSEVSMNEDMEVSDTKVGGLSGITYNPKKKEYYILSNDASAPNPARFYTIAIDNWETRPSVNFKSATALLSNTGKPFISKMEYETLLTKGKSPRYTTPDPKNIVYLPKEQKLVWINQGTRDSIGGKMIYQQPAINLMEITGRTISTYQLPKPFKIEATSGPAPKKGLTAMAISPSEEKLFITTEDPLIEETADPQTYDTGFVRIYQYRNPSKSVETFYAYPVDIPNDPSIAHAQHKNGVTAMYALDDSTLLVLERVSLPNEENKVRLYKTTLQSAYKANPRKGLKERKYFTPLKKELVMDFSTIPDLAIGNITGMTMGPKVKGKQTMVFISNNDFQPGVASRFYFFWVN